MCYDKNKKILGYYNHLYLFVFVSYNHGCKTLEIRENTSIHFPTVTQEIM